MLCVSPPISLSPQVKTENMSARTFGGVLLACVILICLVIGTNMLHDVCITSAQTGEQKNGCHDTKDEMVVCDTSPDDSVHNQTLLVFLTCSGSL